MGLPVVCFLPALAVVGIVGALLGLPEDVVHGIQFGVLPAVMVVPSLILVAHFYRRRSGHQMTRGERGDHRFVAALTTIAAGFGHETSLLPLIVCAVCLGLMMVRTKLPAEALGPRGERE